MSEDKSDWSKRGHIKIVLINARRTYFDLDLPADLTQQEAALLNLRLDEIKQELLGKRC